MTTEYKTVAWVGRCWKCKKQFRAEQAYCPSEACPDCPPIANIYGVRPSISWRGIRGRVSEAHKCGGKCRSSKGFVCDCSCGGVNHGKG